MAGCARQNRKASVDEGDDIENYKTVLEKHINRMEVAEKVITELRPKMKAFHQKVEGSLAKIEGLFTDMAPEPQKVRALHLPCSSSPLPTLCRHTAKPYHPRYFGRTCICSQLLLGGAHFTKHCRQRKKNIRITYTPPSFPLFPSAPRSQSLLPSFCRASPCPLA